MAEVSLKFMVILLPQLGDARLSGISLPSSEIWCFGGISTSLQFQRDSVKPSPVGVS